MGIITVFLIVLIAALGIGNGLLYVTRPGAGGKDEEGGESNFNLVMVKEPNAAELANLGSRYNALHQKVEMAHSRISALEEALSPGRTPAKGEGIEDKIRKFDHFRGNAMVEMKAIKEILIDLQNRGITAKAKKFVPRGTTGRKDAEDMRRIIYRSAPPAKGKRK